MDYGDQIQICSFAKYYIRLLKKAPPPPPSPIAEASPTIKPPVCLNQIGNIKYQPPPGWEPSQDFCDSFTSPDIEENYEGVTPKNGAELRISKFQGLISDDCKSEAENLSYFVLIKCTTVKGNKLAIYNLNYEGLHLIYYLNYNGEKYEFRISSAQRDKYKWVLDQIVNNLEYL